MVHLPKLLQDLLSVVGVTLWAAWEDALKSAEVWDRKHYHVRADRLRDEWTWALAVANTAEGLAERDALVTREHLDRLRKLIRPTLEVPGRPPLRNVEAFRGAARATGNGGGGKGAKPRATRWFRWRE